jgi:paraquat-inducible protein A
MRTARPPAAAARRSHPVPGAASAAESARGPRRVIGPLLVLSLALVPVTWWLPLFTARVPFLWRQEVSIASGLVELWTLDLVLCAVVFFFSVLAPLAKGVALVWVWYGVPAARAAGLLDRLSLLGKLALTEAFLLAVVIVGLKGVGIGRVEVSWGLHAFVGALVLSFAASTWAWAALARA